MTGTRRPSPESRGGPTWTSRTVLSRRVGTVAHSLPSDFFSRSAVAIAGSRPNNEGRVVGRGGQENPPASDLTPWLHQQDRDTDLSLRRRPGTHAPAMNPTAGIVLIDTNGLAPQALPPGSPCLTRLQWSSTEHGRSDGRIFLPGTRRGPGRVEFRERRHETTPVFHSDPRS